MADVMSSRNLGATVELILNPLEGFKADQRLVLALREADAPFRIIVIARIELAIQYIQHPLHVYAAFAVFRKGGLLLQKGFYLDRRAKPIRSEAFQRLLNNGGQRFVPYQHFTVTGTLIHTVAAWRSQYPVAVHQSRTHSVLHLLGVFLTLMLRYACQQVFHQLAVRIFTEFNGGRLEYATGILNRHAQFEMRLQAASQPANVVDDDDHLIMRVLAKKFQHLLNGGTVNQAAGDAFLLKNFHDFEITVFREFPAARFLGRQPMPVFNLVGR